MSQPTYTYAPGINPNVAAELMDANVRVKAELDSLHEELHSSLTAWQTEKSRITYDTAKARWDEAANTMPISLQAASDTLQRMTDIMNKTEDGVTGSF